MKVEELKKIVSTLSVETMGEMLEEKGFRHTNRYLIEEFKPLLFWGITPDETVESEDKENDFKYIAKLYRQIKGYEGITFVDLVVWKLHRNQKCPMTPRKILLYTDAPINEEYEREQASPIKCAKCKKTYIKKEVMEWYGKVLCQRCVAITALSESYNVEIYE